MKKILLASTLLFGGLLVANAQPVQQSGSVTPGHATCWVTNGVARDCGNAAIPYLTSIGTVGSGPTICANSGPPSGAYNQFCLGATATGGGTLSLYNYGGASGGLSFNVNGTQQGFGIVALPVTTNDVACIANTSGNLKDCGFSGSTGPWLPLAGGTMTGPLITPTGDLIINGGTAIAGLATVTGGGILNSEVKATVPQGGTGESSFTANLPLLGNGTSGFLQGTLSGNTTVFVTGGSGSYVGCMQFDGSGNATGTGSNCGNSGSTSPGGSNTYIQYNCSGAFCGASALTWNSGTNTLTGPDSGTWTSSGFTGVANLDLVNHGLIEWTSQALQFYGAGGTAGNTAIDIVESGGSTRYARLAEVSGNFLFKLPTNGVFGFTASSDPTGGLANGFSALSGGGVACGNGTPGDASCLLKLATLTATSVINLPDGGVFSSSADTFGSPSNAITHLLGTSALASPTQNTGYIGFGPSGLGLQFYASISAGPVCPIDPYSAYCTFWQMQFFSIDNFQVWGLENDANDNHALQVGAVRYATSMRDMSQLIFTDNIVAPGAVTSSTITAGGSGYVQSTTTASVSGGSCTQDPGGLHVYVSGGVVIALSVEYPGYGCTIAPTVAFADTSGGTGAAATLTIASGTTNANLGPVMLFHSALGTQFGSGFGQADLASYDVRLGAVLNTGVAWDFAGTQIALRVSGLKLETTNGSTDYTCGSMLANASGTLAITVCNPIGTFGTIVPGSGGTPATYSNVAAISNYGVNATLDIVVNSDGTVHAGGVTLGNNAGTGYQVGEVLTVSSGSVGGLTGFSVPVATLASTPAPISAGVWQGTVIGGTWGGTGVNNGSNTLTLAASLTTTGAGAPTLAFPSSSFTFTFPGASADLAYLVGSATNGHCVEFSGTAGGLADTGSACGSGGGNALFGTTSGNVSGDLVSLSNTTVGVQDSGIAAANLALLSAANLFTGTSNTFQASGASGINSAITLTGSTSTTGSESVLLATDTGANGSLNVVNSAGAGTTNRNLPLSTTFNAGASMTGGLILLSQAGPVIINQGGTNKTTNQAIKITSPTAIAFTNYTTAGIIVNDTSGNLTSSTSLKPGTNNHFSYGGSAPAVSACGTSPAIDANATDSSGTVTVGSVATSCTVTFANAYTSFNHCRITSQSAISGLAYTYTKTAITVTASVLGGDAFDYSCDGV